jgi:hypothetical protein
MNKLLIMFLCVFLTACGSGGSSDNTTDSVSSSTVANKYQGQTFQATLHENNIDDFVQVLFNPIDVTSPVLSRSSDNTSSQIKQLQTSGHQVNTLIKKVVESRLNQTTNLAARAVSYVDYDSCYLGGSVSITGDIDEESLTGTLNMNFMSCADGDTVINGPVTFIVYQYNHTYEAVEHFSISYIDLNVSGPLGQYTTSSKGVGIIDFNNQTITSTQTAHTRFDDQEVLLENFKSVQNASGEFTMTGKLYLSEYGYVDIATNTPFISYSATASYPDSGGPLVLTGANQAVSLSPKENGSYFEAEMMNADQEMTSVFIGNSSPFVSFSYNTSTVYGDLDSVTFMFYLSEALDTERSTLSDLKLVEAGGAIIPADITYSDQYDHIVTITPTGTLKHSTQYTFSLDGNWYSVFGKTLQMDPSLGNITGPDSTGPKVVSVTPVADDSLISRASSFEIVFDEAINPEFIASDDQFLKLTGENYYTYEWVSTTASASGNTLTITPTDPLIYGETYTLTLGSANNSSFQDTNGNSSWFYSDDDEWSYKTELYTQRIDLGVSLNYFDIDKTTNTLYGLDQVNKELVVIDLTTDIVVSRRSLIRKPSQLCIHAESDRLYMTTNNSSFIEEFKLSDLSLINSIGWSGGLNDSDDSSHYDIQCTADKLYVVDADWSSQVYSIDRNAPFIETQLDAMSSIGDILVTNTGDIYTTLQYGWSSYSDVDGYQRFQLDADNNWALIDEDGLNSWNDRSANLESPLFLDETNNHLISNRYIFNSLNLKQVVYDFGEGVKALDADFSTSLLATNGAIYSLETYNQVMTLPVRNIDRAKFDSEGDLYMLKNSDSSLYFTKQSEILE